MRDRIVRVQEYLKRRGAGALVVFTSDPHSSEYVAERWKFREFLSGFTGSAGTLVVTQHSSAVWTDSRYFVQAEAELAGSDILLMREGLEDVPSVADWSCAECLRLGDAQGVSAGSGVRVEVLVDAESTSLQQFVDLSRSVEGSRIHQQKYKNNSPVHEIVVCPTPNLWQELWQDRPDIPNEEIYEIPKYYTGERRDARLLRLREFMAESDCSAYLLSSLDEIAWILNIRGADVAFTPIFYAYLLVFKDSAILFTHYQSIDSRVPIKLELARIRFAPYADCAEKIAEIVQKNNAIIGADPRSLNTDMHRLLGEGFLALASPVNDWKAIKNEQEIACLRRTMQIDGAALVQCLHWVDSQSTSNSAESADTQEVLSEEAISLRLDALRAQNEDFVGNSFTSIVGWKEHGAIIHYSEKASAPFEGRGLVLIDSGGQYRFGTSDITRTLLVDANYPQSAAPHPDLDNWRREYTLVLKAHIALASAVFPEGTTGAQLDAITRAPLWQAGLNYGHGTGHGVGFALSVHEGPQNISPKGTQVPLKAGMICSNEPGYYVEGSHGIRLENLVLVVPHPEYANFLCLETLSLAPFQQELIEPSILDPLERAWLNDYHERVYDRLAAQLAELRPNNAGGILRWLKEQTSAI